MQRISIVALLAIILGSSGCCFRRNQPAAPVAVCQPPAPVCVDPCAQGVTYGYGSGYGAYGVPMQ